MVTGDYSDRYFPCFSFFLHNSMLCYLKRKKEIKRNWLVSPQSTTWLHVTWLGARLVPCSPALPGAGVGPRLWQGAVGKLSSLKAERGWNAQGVPFPVPPPPEPGSPSTSQERSFSKHLPSALMRTAKNTEKHGEQRPGLGSRGSRKQSATSGPASPAASSVLRPWICPFCTKAHLLPFGG